MEDQTEKEVVFEGAEQPREDVEKRVEDKEARERAHAERKAEDATRMAEIHEEIEAMTAEQEQPKHVAERIPEKYRAKVDAMERALGVPIDREKAAKTLENSKTLDPIRYFLRAREYTGSLWKAFKMTFTTGGFRDPNRDAVFTNRLNNLAPEETKLHETMHAISEQGDAEKGTDVFGAERTTSGIESVDDEGTIRLTGLNEGLTQYFTLRSREEMKMRGPKALGAYVREVKVVRDIARILDAAGMDGNKVLAEAYTAGNADGIREALDKAGGPGTFDTLTESMDQGQYKEVARLISTFEQE